MRNELPVILETSLRTVTLWNLTEFILFSIFLNVSYLKGIDVIFFLASKLCLYFTA